MPAVVDCSFSNCDGHISILTILESFEVKCNNNYYHYYIHTHFIC